MSVLFPGTGGQNSQAATQSHFKCQACGVQCSDTRGLYWHMKTMTRVRPGGPTCLQGFSKLDNFKAFFTNMLRREKVIISFFKF